MTTTNILPPLYKMDSKGKIRIWEILACANDEGQFLYQQTYGVLSGKQQCTQTFITKGKNIGKANETSPWEQCQLETESLWTKQKERKGYSENIPSEKPKMPMLAKSYNKDKKKIRFPAYSQPKLDGIRCLMKVGYDGGITLISRQNKAFLSLDHIKDSISESFIRESLGYWFDGELYNHEFRDDFQSIVSAIKRDKPSDLSSLIQYHTYDFCSDKDFDKRSERLEDLVAIAESDYFKFVQTDQIENHPSFLRKYREYLSKGYEGAMIRNTAGPYEFNRRSPNLQKHKEFFDEEFEIVDAVENKGKMAGECTFICTTDKGATFGVKPKGSSELRRQMWVDFQKGKYTGKYMTVRYFEWTTSDPPVPRFPIGISVRDYE